MRHSAKSWKCFTLQAPVMVDGSQSAQQLVFASSVNGGHFAGCVVDGNSLVAHKTFLRFPFVACEIFTCEVDILLKAVVEDEELMDMLFSFLDPEHPHCSQGLASKFYNFKKDPEKLGKPNGKNQKKIMMLMLRQLLICNFQDEEHEDTKRKESYYPRTNFKVSG